LLHKKAAAALDFALDLFTFAYRRFAREGSGASQGTVVAGNPIYIGPRYAQQNNLYARRCLAHRRSAIKSRLNSNLGSVILGRLFANSRQNGAKPTRSKEHIMKSKLVNSDEHEANFEKIFAKLRNNHQPHTVFSDFCEMSAIAFSNAVDSKQYAQREARYFEIIKPYAKTELNLFAELLSCVTLSLEDDMHDCLGALFMQLEMANHWRGQYFTPSPVAELMAKVTLADAADYINEHGFITLSEPCCGAGVMVIASAIALRDSRINYQQALHVVAQDIDATAVHMAYIQLSLLHIPAIVLHGNSLDAGATHNYWVTPAHVMGGWDYKLRRAAPIAPPAPLPEESPASETTAARDEIVTQRLQAVEQLSLL
jgi:hypothetical protein